MENNENRNDQIVTPANETMPNEFQQSVRDSGQMDLTNLNVKEEQSILPDALRAANLFNKANTIGSIETQLPVSNFTVVCNPLASMDELSAKTVTGSIQMYTNKNIEIFWSAVEFPSNSWVRTLKDFMLLSEADFKAIVFGVMKASFGTLNESSFACKNPGCTNTDEDKVFKFTPKMKNIQIDYPSGIFESPNNDYRRDTFIAELGNVTITYKFDSIGERVELFNGKTNDEIRENIQTIKALVTKIELLPMFIDSIKIENITLTAKEEIMVFINKLNLSSKEIIEETNNSYIEHILGYEPKFNTVATCPHCDHENEWEDIDLMVEFFLKVSAIY